MLVQLRDLLPNPFRDFKVDPIDPQVVKKLRDSIKEDGFWGGVVCRRVNGDVQICAGQHRVDAAIDAGLRAADVFIGEFDDPSVIRVYARENATQRGNTGTAQAGTIASAIRFLAKQLLTGQPSREITTRYELGSQLGNLQSEKGMGEPFSVWSWPRTVSAERVVKSREVPVSMAFSRKRIALAIVPACAVPVLPRCVAFSLA